MDDIIKIKCPFCACLLSVKNQVGIETKFVTCPNCKRKSAFPSFKRIIDYDEEHTVYPEQNMMQNTSSKEETLFAQDKNLSIGSIIVNGRTIRLNPGKNIIGRKANQSAATIQIPVTESLRMSREHLVIEVKRVPGKGFVHYASLCKERINATYIGNERLEYGDCIVLNNGDLLKLPDATLRFEIVDDEGTVF